MTSVLVTGASGFLGKHLVPRLRAEGHETNTMDHASGDVSDRATWQRFAPADVVVHLAAKSFVPDSWEFPSAFLRTNLSGTVEALEYCRLHRAHLVFLSSYIYGDVVRQPVSESSALAATNPYALSKKLAEEACQFYAERYGVSVTVLRPFNIYGPGQSETFLVPTILKQLESRTEVRVRDLEPRRDYIYVTDVVDAIIRAVAASGGYSVLNLGSGRSSSVAELIHAIQQVWGTHLPVRSDGVRRQDEIMDTIADISRAEACLGWKPRFTLRQGLEHFHSAQ